MSKVNRRGFLKGALLALASLPVLESLLGSNASAAAAPEVDKTKGMAKSLGYVSNAAVDCAGGKCAPKFKDGAKCSTCSFYKKVDDKWGTCTLVKPGSVAAEGWCKSYIKKA